MTPPEDYDHTLIGLSEWTRDTAEFMIQFLEELSQADDPRVPQELHRDVDRLVEAYKDVWRALYAIKSASRRSTIEPGGKTQ